jgi:hypothetical protein
MSRVSGYQPIEPYSPGVSAYLPELAVASYRAGLPQQDLQQINTWSKLYDKHRELLKMDNKDANEEFFKLDEGIQEALKSTFDNPDYLNKPNNWTILGTIGSIAKNLTSPITYGMKALQGYSQALTGTVGGTLAYAKQTGQYTPSMLNFWADDWDGKRIWNVEYTKKLEETYGPGMSALAKGLVTGWTPGRVIEEAGGVTPELETALAFMQENPGDFANILGDYRRAQVSPGREVARRQMRLSPDASLIEEKMFDRISGTYDATFQILADPLTWATAGTWAAGKALVKSIPAGQRVGALAQLTLKENLQPRAPIINKGAVYGQLWKKGIKPELAVPAVFGLDDVKKVWDGIPDKTPGLGPLLKQFREGTPEVQARVMISIAENYPAYNNDAIVRKLAFSEIYPTFSKMGPNKYIEDSDSAAQYFINADHTKDLFSGKSNSMVFYRTNNVVTATKSSLWANSIRKSIGDIFSSRLKGTTDVNLFEAIQKTDNVVDTAYLEGKYIEVGSDVSQSLKLISDLRQSDPLFKFAATQMKTFPSRVNKLVSRAPLGRPIFTNDDMVGETLNTFRDTARLVLPKEEAAVLTQRFAELKEYDRIVLLRGLYTDILHSSGLAATPGGATIIETILKEKFGGMGSFATGNVLDIPKNLQVSDLARVGAELGSNSDKVKVQSPLHNFQFTPGIGQLDWLEIAKLQSDSARVFKGLRRLGVIINGQAVSQYTNAWTLLTLAPKLGIRATMDELFLFALYGPKEVMYNFVRGTGRTAVKLLAIAKGKPEGLSLTGEHLFRIQEMIKPEERIALQKAIEIEFPGDFSTQKSVYVNRIFGLALDKLKIEQNLGQYIPGSKFLSDANIEHLREFFENNPLGFDALASSQARTAGLSGGFIRPTEDLMTNEVMETAMKERGVQNAGKWVNLPGSAAKEQRVLGQYSNVSARFTSNYEKFGIKTDTPQQIFLRNNGLENQQDFTNAVTDVLKLFGVKLPAGKTYLDLVRDVKSGLLVDPMKELAEGPGRTLLNSLSEYATLKGSASDVEIITRWVEQHLLDLRKSFHGSADLTVFNTKLFNRVKQGSIKQVSKGEIDKVITPFRWNQLPIQEFDELVKDNLIAGDLLVPFQAGPTNLKEWIAEYGTKIFEAMDQQVTSYFRTPVFMSFYLERMENFAKGGFRESYANQIVLKTVADREYQLGRKLTSKERLKSVNFANELTAKAMVEYSVQDSLNSIMKFADNPDVRTALAWNLRNGSRFYRATEDFIRRLYRLKDHSLKTIMRMRLSALGLSASGFIHEDAQGQGYLVMPMDDLIFQVVDKPLRVLTGGKSGYSQPLVGDFTFKLQQLNPSFGPDAASPTLSGPLASLNIYLVKSLLGRLGPDGRYAADKIDNILLGDIGDNLDLKKAVLPLSVNRLWSIIGAGEKDKQEASAVHQVIAYNAAHGNGLPVDATPEEQYEYIKNIRISGHNLVVMRNILGLLPIPVSPTLKETKDIPNFLKEVGIVSVRQEFFDIFEGVLSSPNPRIDDPYEEALAIYIGKNPNKLIYTVSRAEKTSDIAFKKTEEVKNWYIKNKGLVEKYGEAAWLAAPSVGDFTAGTYAWFEAADLIDNRDLETYLREVQIAVDRQNYFDLEERAVEQIAQTADSYAIKEIGAQMNMAQEMLLNSNPLLKQRFATGDFGVEKEKQYFTNLSYLLADNSVEMNPATRDKLNRALRIMSNTAYKINSDNNMSSAYRRTIRDEAIADLSELGNIDYTVRQATKAIFIPILKDLSRDTQIK